MFDLKYPCSTTDNYTYILNEKEVIVPEVCRYPPDNWNHILRDLDDPNFPWPGVVFGMIIGSIWYWCADQVIVQRCLSARDLSNGKLFHALTYIIKIKWFSHTYHFNHIVMYKQSTNFYLIGLTL